MSPITITALIIFAVTYILMLAFQKIRPYITVGSALIFVALGIIASVNPTLFGEGFFLTSSGAYDYSIMSALSEIDWNVIMMIAGTMGTVFLFIESKMPQLMSDVLISKMPNVKWVVVALSLFAGVVSAFVDNVATVLMIAPVALAFCKKLGISPVSSIICIAVSSNLQGAATLVGDTTSILLAKAANLDFSDFFVHDGHVGMFWVVQAGAIASALIILFMFRKDNGKIEFTGRTKVEDKFPTFLLVGTVFHLSQFPLFLTRMQQTAASISLISQTVSSALLFSLLALSVNSSLRRIKRLSKTHSKKLTITQLYFLQVFLL